METTRLKYNLVFINLTWLLGVQMDNIILRGSHSLKILNIVFWDHFIPNMQSIPRACFLCYWVLECGTFYVETKFNSCLWSHSLQPLGIVWDLKLIDMRHHRSRILNLANQPFNTDHRLQNTHTPLPPVRIFFHKKKKRFRRKSVDLIYAYSSIWYESMFIENSTQA